jgi:hypothetical protein
LTRKFAVAKNSVLAVSGAGSAVGSGEAAASGVAVVSCAAAVMTTSKSKLITIAAVRRYLRTIFLSLYIKDDMSIIGRVHQNPVRKNVSLGQWY